MGNDMKPLRTFRQFTAMSLVVIGALVVVRGVYYAVTHNMGWHAIIMSLVIGSLVISLGIARWRYWQTR
jgi:membrane protein YdbS with pleckstrin-like domain